MKVVPPTGRPIFIYIPHQTSEKSKLARLATMAIRAVLARRLCNDQRTILLESIVLPIKLSAHIMAQNTAFEADTLRYALLSR